MEVKKKTRFLLKRSDRSVQITILLINNYFEYISNFMNNFIYSERMEKGGEMTAKSRQRMRSLKLIDR